MADGDCRSVVFSMFRLQPATIPSGWSGWRPTWALYLLTFPVQKVSRHSFIFFMLHVSIRDRTQNSDFLRFQVYTTRPSERSPTPGNCSCGRQSPWRTRSPKRSGAPTPAPAAGWPAPAPAPCLAPKSCRPSIGNGVRYSPAPPGV